MLTPTSRKRATRGCASATLATPTNTTTYVTGICELPERGDFRLLAHISDTKGFLGQCMDLSDLPTVPPYWPRMRRMNIGGPARLGVLADPPPLCVEEFDRMRQDGAVMVDCRSPEAFAAHIPGALNVGVGNSFPTWAGSVLPYDTPLILVLERADDLWEICWQLLRIGYELPKGWLADGMFAWRTAGMPIEVLPQWTIWQLRRALETDRDVLVLDVRQPTEWAEGHIPEAVHISGAEITRRADEIPKDRPVATICGSGYRSSVAASVLKCRGHKEVANVLGGMTGWQAEALPVVR